MSEWLSALTGVRVDDFVSVLADECFSECEWMIL